MHTRDGQGSAAARAGSEAARWRGPLGWALLAAAAGAVAAPLDPNLLEEGIVVHAAERMLGGEHLYRDIVLHTAPLPYELLALLFRLFGAKLEVARAAVVAFQAAGTGLLYAGLRRAGLGILAHPAAAAVAVAPLVLVPLFSTFFYTTLAFYLALAAFYTGLRSARSNAWAAATGALVGSVALCKQSTGVILAVALLPGLWAVAAPGARIRRLAAYAAGGASMAAATLTLYAIRGDLNALLFAQIDLPLLMFSEATFRMPYINLWPPGRLEPAIQENWAMYLPSLYHMRFGPYAVIGRGMIVFTQLLYALPLVALAATALRALPVFRRPHPALWLHGGVLFSMAANLHPRADWGHLVVALPLALVQLLLLAARGDAPLPQTRPLRAAAGLLLALLLGGGADTGRWLYSIAGEPLFGPRVPLRPVSNRTPALPRVIHYLRHRVRPGEAIFVARQEPLLYFATGTRNPTPFPGIIPAARELQEPAILAGLEQVRFVVMSDIDQPSYTYYGDELPQVQAYLERHFETPPDFPIDDWSWITVFRRGPDRGATAIDLIAERPRARAWVRDAEGTREEVPEMPPQRLAARLLRRPLPVALGALGGGLDFELEIPPKAEFQAGVGYRALASLDHQYIHPRGTTLSVSIARQGEAFEELASQRIDDRAVAGRRWTPMVADLSTYAGERVTLRLEVKADRPIRGERVAWWGSPRIAVRPEEDGPAP